LVPALFLGLLAPALGCSSAGSVNIGDTQNLGGKLSDYAATWDGYAEAYTFQPSGTDNVHLVLDAQGNGTLQVGNDALLPAPTDPNVGYPPNVNIDPKAPAALPPSTLKGGVLYPVYATQVQSDRIQLGLKPLDYYQAWCALQTPYYVLQGYMGAPGNIPGGHPDASVSALDGGSVVPIYGYSILPGAGGSESTDSSGNAVCFVQNSLPDGSYTDQQIDCGKFYLGTFNVCSCTASACSSFPAVPSGTAPADYPAELDGALDSTGKMLTGTLVVDGTRVIVHLTHK
jgi:hypothetical protein